MLDSGVLERENSANIKITKQGDGNYNWEIALFQQIPGGVKAGNIYHIQYQAKASKEATLETWVQQWHDNFDPIYLSGLLLTTETQTFVDTFVVASSDSQVVWGFELGAMGSNLEVWIDAVHFIQFNASDVNSEKNIIVKDYKSEQNYPNPFNPTTTINFTIPTVGSTKLSIYDVLGQEVVVLVNKEMNAGSYKCQFDASNLTSGLYLYKLQSNDYSQAKKMILLR